MELQFTKMHGLGNDFIVINAIEQQVALTTEQVRFLADRHFGIGCDQLLLVESPRREDVDFNYRIFNADGGEVEQCGNGARCFAHFVREKNLTQADEIRVETASGIIVLNIEPDGQVTVDMGAPEFSPQNIPFQAESQSSSYALTIDGTDYDVAAVSMGNPHAVFVVENIDKAPVNELGPLIESHPRFPQRVNVGFMQVVNSQFIRLRVYERGAAETLACGTGACAAVVSGRQMGLLDDKVKVELPGGQLLIKWAGIQEPVFMTGPATTVFEGKIQL